MERLIEIVKKIPFLLAFCQAIRHRYSKYRLGGKDAEQVFSEIYRNNKWRGKDSLSGTGSDVYQTAIIIKELPVIFSDYGVSTVLATLRTVLGGYSPVIKELSVVNMGFY